MTQVTHLIFCVGVDIVTTQFKLINKLSVNLETAYLAETENFLLKIL